MALRTTTPARSATAITRIVRPIRGRSPPRPRSAFATLRNHQDFGPLLVVEFSIAVAIAVSVPLVPVTCTGIGRLGERGANDVRAGRLDPIERFDRGAG